MKYGKFYVYYYTFFVFSVRLVKINETTKIRREKSHIMMILRFGLKRQWRTDFIDDYIDDIQSLTSSSV